MLVYGVLIKRISQFKWLLLVYHAPHFNAVDTSSTIHTMLLRALVQFTTYRSPSEAPGSTGTPTSQYIFRTLRYRRKLELAHLHQVDRLLRPNRTLVLLVVINLGVAGERIRILRSMVVVVVVLHEVILVDPGDLALVLVRQRYEQSSVRKVALRC